MKHVVFLMANNSSVPYFSWFAERSQELKDVKITFIALHRSEPLMLEEMKSYGCDCIWIPFDNSRRKQEWLRVVFRLYKTFRKLRPDVVHAHLFDDTLPSVIAARWAGVKTIVATKQDTTFHWYYAPKAVFLDRLINRKATHLIAVSEECRDFILEKEKAEAGKVHLIHHGIPIQKRLATIQENTREQFIRQYGLENRIVIGTVARLIEWKGYRYIIEAAKEVVRLNDQVVFLFVGNGDQKSELQSLVQENGLENHVVFTDWIEQRDMPSLFSLFDIYLHAASMEPFGFVIAEAMAHSLPIVSTATGSAKDGIVHKENGYLVADKNAAEIVEGLRFMLEADRKAIGQKAFEAGQRLYDFPIMYGNYLQLYDSAR